MKKFISILVICCIFVACLGFSGCSTTKTVVNISFDEEFTIGEMVNGYYYKVMKGQEHIGQVGLSSIDSSEVKIENNNLYVSGDYKPGIYLELFAQYYTGDATVSFNNSLDIKADSQPSWMTIDGKLSSQASFLSKTNAGDTSLDIVIKNIKPMSATHFDWKLHSYIDANEQVHFPNPDSTTVSFGGSEISLYDADFKINFDNDKFNFTENGQTEHYNYTQQGDSIVFTNDSMQHVLKLDKNQTQMALYLTWEVFEGETLIFEPSYALAK